MKDYAKRSNVSLKPNRNSKVQTPFDADRWLIIFIITALILAALSASYTFYQKWRQNHTKTTATTLAPVKTTLDKIVQKSSENKQAQDTVSPKNIAKAIKKKAKTIETKTDAAKTADTEPKYDFYQILPKMTVDVQKNNDANDSSEPQ